LVPRDVRTRNSRLRNPKARCTQTSLEQRLLDLRTPRRVCYGRRVPRARGGDRMSDDAKDDRKDALSSRFNTEEDKTSRTSKTSNTPTTSQTSSTTKVSRTDKTSSTEKTATTEKTSSSDEPSDPGRPSTRNRRAVTMYLPEDLVKELDLQFQELNLEMQREHDIAGPDSTLCFTKFLTSSSHASE
jgi:hypothetical protein